MRYTQLRAQLVNTRDQQRNTKRPTHHRLLIVYTLSEAQCEIAHSLCNTLNLDRLVVGEGMVLGSHSGVVDHGAGICSETRHGAAKMSVYFHDLFDGGGLEEWRLDSLLDPKHDAFGGLDSDCC